jgi:hypothetical protein
MPPKRAMSGWPPTTPNAEKYQARGSGSGMAGIDGLNAGAPVTAQQMRALFGAGMHPLATQRLEQLGDADLTEANVQTAAGWACRSRSSTSNQAGFGLRWRSGLPRSTSRPGYQETGRGQARTPHPNRATRHLAHPSRRSNRRTRCGPEHDQSSTQPRLRGEPGLGR